METTETRAGGVNPLRKIMVLGRTHYLSIPLESARKYSLEKGMCYEFEYRNGSLVFKPITEGV